MDEQTDTAQDPGGDTQDRSFEDAGDLPHGNPIDDEGVVGSAGSTTAGVGDQDEADAIRRNQPSQAARLGDVLETERHETTWGEHNVVVGGKVALRIQRKDGQWLVWQWNGVSYVRTQEQIDSGVSV